MAAVNIKINTDEIDNSLFESFIKEFVSRGGSDDAKLSDKIKRSFKQLSKSGAMIDKMSFEDKCKAMYDVPELRKFYEKDDELDELFDAPTLQPENGPSDNTEVIKEPEVPAVSSSKEIVSKDKGETKKKITPTAKKPESNSPKEGALEFSQDSYLRFLKEEKELVDKLSRDHREINMSVNDISIMNRLKQVKFSNTDYLDSKFNSYGEVIHAALKALERVANEDGNEEIKFCFEAAGADIKIHDIMVERKRAELRTKYGISK